MELLPCPFCGGTDVSVEEGSTFRLAVAICNNCDAAAPEARAIHGDKKKTQEAALTEWNRRASPTGAPVSEDRKDAELYKELIYAVASKFPGESRHQTALRYIRNAEKGSGNATMQEDKP